MAVTEEAPPINFAAIDNLPEGADRFFKIFARFEFALKETGFTPKVDGKATASWPCLSKTLGDKFFADIAASGRADTLLRHPLKRQVIMNGTLEFAPAGPPCNCQQLFEAVCCVRNNLFHGGKGGRPDADPADPLRDARLVREAQWVLEQALQTHDELRWVFEARY